jgi:serine/threonine protein kinase
VKKFSSLIESKYTAVRRITPYNFVANNKEGNKVFIKVRSHSSKREVEMLKKLNHPAVINMTGLSYEGDYAILEFPHFSEETLKDTQHVSAVGLEPLFLAIHHLIDNGVVHCDIKPSNVLVRNNQLKLIDFDQARIPGSKIKITNSFYTPPEICKGTAHKYSDLWSLGALLSFVVLGKRIFEVYNLGWDEKGQGVVRTLKKHSVRSNMVQMIQTLMEHDPDKRFISLEESVAIINNLPDLRKTITRIDSRI